MHKYGAHLNEIGKCVRHDEGFNKRLIYYRSKKVIELCKGPKLLELGCGDGIMTKELLLHFDHLVAVDASEVRIKRAKKNVRKFVGKTVEFHVSYFEDFEYPKKFDTIIASGILEHVEEPVLILKKAKQWLKKNGCIIIVVPNAESLHRRIGKLIGLVSDLHELGKHDHKVSHRRYYDWEMLANHIKQSGLKIEEMGGILLKPLSNKQMEDFDTKTTDALYEIGKELPRYCAELYAKCRYGR